MPLGFSLLAYAFAFLLEKRARYLWCMGLFALFTTVNIMYYVDASRDWMKQRALVHEISRNLELRNGTTFPVIDNTVYYNLESRRYRNYEWTSMFKKAFDGERTRYADMLGSQSLAEWERVLQTEKMKFTAQYALQDYQAGSPDCVMVVEKGSLDISGYQILGQLFSDLSRTWGQQVDQLSMLLEVKCVPL